jgi:hypothetical protein
MVFRLSLLGLVVLAAVGIPAAMATSVKEPAYTVDSRVEGMELRTYAPMIRAETVVRGTYEEAVNSGFRILANYIFGANTSKSKIAMTAPVAAQPSGGEKIAMTAPVGAAATDAGWRVSFVMPAEYRMETLPQPLDPRIELHSVPAQRVAALSFSGRAQEKEVAAQREKLEALLAGACLQPAGDMVVAQYDPPWTLPFLRRNEILVTVLTCM